MLRTTSKREESIHLNIIICTHNRAGQLQRVFACLAEQNAAPGCSWEVLVVDNASTDETRAVTEAAIAGRMLPGLRYVHEARPGLTPARRRGVADATGDWIAFVDDDNLLDPGWVAAMACAIRAHPDAGGIGGEVRLAWEQEPPDYLQPFGFCFAEQQVGQADRTADSLAGAGMVLRREALLASGWPDGPLLQDRIGKSLVSGGDGRDCAAHPPRGISLVADPGGSAQPCHPRRSDGPQLSAAHQSGAWHELGSSGRADLAGRLDFVAPARLDQTGELDQDRERWTMARRAPPARSHRGAGLGRLRAGLHARTGPLRGAPRRAAREDAGCGRGSPPVSPGFRKRARAWIRQSRT